jgi:hypothetical protein
VQRLPRRHRRAADDLEKALQRLKEQPRQKQTPGNPFKE